MICINTTKRGKNFGLNQSFRHKTALVANDGARVHTVGSCFSPSRNHVVHESIPEVDAVFPYLRLHYGFLEIAFGRSMSTKEMYSLFQSGHSLQRVKRFRYGLCEKLRNQSVGLTCTTACFYGGIPTSVVVYRTLGRIHVNVVYRIFLILCFLHARQCRGVTLCPSE